MLQVSSAAPSGCVCVLVEAFLQGVGGDALCRAPLVHAEQSVQQVVDVGFESLPLHPVLQKFVHFVTVGVILRHTDVVVADSNGSEELVVDPDVQVLVEQVEALLQGFFRP